MVLALIVMNVRFVHTFSVYFMLPRMRFLAVILLLRFYDRW